ncbi:m-AAA protease-interacting protein 1, mitochondrial [Girardinichthys multiradiatus]|uniref:m-AAA protease-interacting protein 1, mitochondrial n=1 Tax=Girardinichthys multiradiatus TaxID=208333 RepID=UPI001FAB5754|nr:m-AAA protease-interacting protein 1, mitochondrial [Girardinichthys multiradiatus]
MQRIAGLAARIPRLASSAAGVQTGDSGLICCKQPAVGLLHRWQQWACLCAVSGRPLSAEPGQRGSRRRFIAGERCRLFSSQAGAEEPPGNPGSQPHISVVGNPDPLTWIRCKFITFLVDLYFEVDINSAEFHRGVKQALVHVSSKMSRGRYHELKGVLTDEMREYVEEKCKLLTKAQRRQLAVNMEDIIFVLLEDISVVFDKHGRTFCFVAIRFWVLSSHEGPDDPEGTKIFKVASSEDGSPQKKLATAVYEFHGELKTGTSPDWMVTTVWHWHWKVAA